jgi:sterol desaturase/sphingolipid hydroxylase (fatty acid hydroxylase superfamily)
LAVSRLSVALPLLALAFPIPVLAAHFAVRRFQGLFVHANIRVDFGPLRWFIASPQFHHWHHTDDLELRDKNFAGEVPLLDWLFGTLHLPAGVWPDHYGIGEDAPSGYLAQLAWPFDRAVDRQPVKTDLVAVGSADDSS